MRFQLLIVAAAVALAAGCDRNDPARSPSTASSPPTSSSPSSSSASGGPTTPANIGQPSSQEKKDGANPVQGQVDPKNREQHRDFQQKGDSAGPTSPDTRPKY